MTDFTSFYSNGKLLITAEYLVLKGALALAVPLKIGQTLSVAGNDTGYIEWVSTVKGAEWLYMKIALDDFVLITSNDIEKAEKLVEILRFAKGLNPSFMSDPKGYYVKTNTEFDIKWGLGSSSTLISNIAWWANCDPYRLNKLAFKGSGYDIACARSASPILYQLEVNETMVKEVIFKPPFMQQLSLVWLNQKQNSRDEIGRFDQTIDRHSEISQINSITREMLHCRSITRFMELMDQHETIISSLVGMAKVKDHLFNDFEGAIKSLGAWGGDFVLVASKKSFEYVQEYFNQKGFHTVVSFQSLVIT